MEFAVFCTCMSTFLDVLIGGNDCTLPEIGWDARVQRYRYRYIHVYCSDVVIRRQTGNVVPYFLFSCRYDRIRYSTVQQILETAVYGGYSRKNSREDRSGTSGCTGHPNTVCPARHLQPRCLIQTLFTAADELGRFASWNSLVGFNVGEIDFFYDSNIIVQYWYDILLR